MKRKYIKPEMDMAIYSTPDVICSTSYMQPFNSGSSYVANYKVTSNNLHK